ncbi:efflux RND transporter periplasmic adaptor subunit [Streptosporangium sp. NBC_01755]|uniref:efflux RND transporter periplasmic adaptor subunit n=1 Tax=Streptosporangium sp. NBC_01755 TaxID=2975949 RepID=UPI002DD86254|nr:efflux RND transporter periplasmic adaptor subunit [Streptosporangium sp. NBC_01755]WSD02818.1 efflux RND transporter periplasmic adaptor subunit [Streptosporangium sp. NBC_01755]
MRPTHLPKNLRTGGLALAALVLVGAGAIVALDGGSDQAPRGEPAFARRGTVTAAVSAAGNTVDDGTRDLAFGGSGTVTKVYVKAGDKVGRGDVLARIGSAPARERYTAAKAQLAAAEEALEEAGSTAESTSGNTTGGVPQQTRQGTQQQGTQGQTGADRSDPAGQTGCEPTATRPPGAGAPPAPTGTDAPAPVPEPAGAEREIRVVPAGGIVPAGYRLTTPPVTPTPVRDSAPASATARSFAPAAALARTSPATPAATPTPTPTAAGGPGDDSPQPAPTVTVTVTAAPTVTVTATATVTVTARPDGGGPPATSEPAPTTRPSGPATNPGGPSGPATHPGPTAAPTTAKPTATARPTTGRTPAPGSTGCSTPKPGANTGTGTGANAGAGAGAGANAGAGAGAGANAGQNSGQAAKQDTAPKTGQGGGADASTGGAGQGTLSVEQAEARVKQAQAELTDATEELAGVRIVAPADGTVMSVAGAVGDSTGTGTFLTLGDLDELQVEALFTESDIGSLELGQQATITLATRQGERYTGTVTGIAPTATTTDRLVRYGVTIAFDKPPADLMVGQTASVTVTVAKSAETLYVPAQAVKTSEGISRVTVQGGTERVVETGVRGDQYVEITSGLAENDRVVMPGGAADGEFPDSSWPETGAGAP